MNRVDALDAIPILSKVSEDNNTFIVHKLEDVGGFGKFGIDMGLK